MLTPNSLMKWILLILLALPDIVVSSGHGRSLPPSGVHTWSMNLLHSEHACSGHLRLRGGGEAPQQRLIFDRAECWGAGRSRALRLVESRLRPEAHDSEPRTSLRREHLANLDEDLVYETVQLDDMEYDEVEDVYRYPCPCGDEFFISSDDLRAGLRIAPCPSCSLTLKVECTPDHEALQFA